MKRILLINDVVGYSHVGMVAMHPILTYMGHHTYNLPTALVSNTLDYGSFNVLETTDYMKGTMPVWRKLGFQFDAVCTGLMFSENQAQLVEGYCRELKEDGSLVFVDPILGDGGRLYNGISLQQVEAMRRMLSVADLTFPNYTEACLLASVPYKPHGISLEEAYNLLDSVAAIGAKEVLITSAKVEGQSCVLGKLHNYENDVRECYFKLDYDELPQAFHGTGDIFSAVLIGHIMNGNPLEVSTRTAMDVVSRLIGRNSSQDDLCLGIPIEKCLDLL